MDNVGIEKNVYRVFLFDLYGKLLTEYQKKIYSDHTINDLAYTEIGT